MIRAQKLYISLWGLLVLLDKVLLISVSCVHVFVVGQLSEGDRLAGLEWPQCDGGDYHSSSRLVQVLLHSSWSGLPKNKAS